MRVFAAVPSLVVEKYLRLLRVPGAKRFVAAGFIGRLPISMLSLGVVLLVTAQNGSYALAGALAATFALAAAFVSPLGLRWADRSGQSRAIPVLVVGESTALILFTVSVVQQRPLALQFALAFAAGACAPHVGSLVRARWAAQLSGSPELQSAFAFEAVVDEVVFVVGPPLMTLIALQIGEPFAMYTCVGLILAGSLWLASQRSSQPPAHPAAAGHGHQRMFSAALVVLLAIMVLLGGVFGAFEVTTIAFSAALGHEPLTGVALALYAFGSLTAGLVMGARPASDTPDRQVLAFSLALAVVGAPMLLVGNISTLMVLSFLAGMSVSPLLIATTTIIELVVPRARLTEALGISISGLAVGVAIGSTSSGALVDSVSDNAGYAVMAGCGVGALIVALAGHRRLHRALRAQ